MVFLQHYCLYILASGIVLLTIGYFNLRRFFWSKEIALYKMDGDAHLVNFANSGRYSVSVIGASNIENMFIRVTDEAAKKKLDIYKIALKDRFFKSGKLGATLFYFNINESGNHLVTILNLEKITVKQSQLNMVSMFEKPGSYHQLSVLIKEYVRPSVFIIGLVSLILGLNALLLAIALYFKPFFN